MINKEWHLANKMPKNPTDNQRAVWHIEHSKNCSCRQMTLKIAKLVEDYKTKKGL